MVDPNAAFMFGGEPKDHDWLGLRASMIDALYFAIASAAGAIGAVVGFGVQLRALRKSRLEIDELGRKAARAAQENEKLKLELQDLEYKVELTRLSREKTELEVAKLRREGAPRSPIITEVSTEEVMKFADVRFSTRRDSEERASAPVVHSLRGMPSAVILGAVILASTMWQYLPDVLVYIRDAIDAFLAWRR